MYFETLSIRPITDEEIPVIQAIERASSIHPWSDNQLATCARGNYTVEVFVDSSDESSDDSIMGYWILQPVVDELNLLSITISQSHQGRGLGKWAMTRLHEKAQLLAAKTIFLEVRQSNEVAQHVYKSTGFIEVGRRKDYYPLTDTKREDAILMKSVITD